MSGTFGSTWTPTIGGNYKITATFMGGGSYGISLAQTSATVVNQGITASPTTSTTSVSNVSMSDLATNLIVGIIAIALVGALILRKR